MNYKLSTPFKLLEYYLVINIDPFCVGHILKVHIYIFPKQSIWHVVGAQLMSTSPWDDLVYILPQIYVLLDCQLVSNNTLIISVRGSRYKWAVVCERHFSLDLFFPTGRVCSLAQMVKTLPATWETRVWSLGREDPLGKVMATHFSILVWEIPGTEEPGGLHSTGSQRVGHDRTTQHTHTYEISTWTSPEQALPSGFSRRWHFQTDQNGSPLDSSG